MSRDDASAAPGRRARGLPSAPAPQFPVPQRPPEGAPNVVMIMLDDTGFAQLGAFGGLVPTPNLDRLAADGLRFNRFHVTAICSASRACALTGRNNHAVGIGLLTDTPMAFPGYRGKIPDTAAAIPRILRGAGYSTYAVGKWHLTPRSERTAAGPFDSWPLGLGFEQYYGFIGGDANHWTPNLVMDNQFIDPPRTYQEGYHLSEDLADRAIRMLQDQRNAAPGKPFFLYFATGALHSPHHVPPEWIEPHRGRFDAGWDVLREEVFARQLQLGVVPAGTELTPRPEWIRPWAALDGDERRMYARQQEVFAGFLSHTDAQIGRLLDHLRDNGQLENTLIIALSDNGASAEGGVEGSANEHRFSNRLPESLESNLDHYDDWGGPETYNHYSWAWAWYGNTPFRLWKRYTWLGGVRVPMIAHWPARIQDPGAVRDTFAHAVDLLPTILDAAGVETPATVDGVIQQPIDGASFLANLDDGDAPSPRDTQYFEMIGSRAIVQGRWKATTDHVSRGVSDEEQLLTGSRDFADDRWSLFDLSRDFSEAHDVADRYPEVVGLLEDIWFDEAARNQVLPVGDTLGGMASAMIRPTWPTGTDRTYPAGSGPIPDVALPLVRNGFTYTLRAAASADPDGVLFALGDWHIGYALHVSDGQLIFTVSRSGDIFELISEQPLAEGPLEVTASYSQAPDGTGRLLLIQDEREVSSLDVAGPLGMFMQHGGSGLRIGHDIGTPVSRRYRTPSRWNGTIDSLRLTVPERPTPSHHDTLREGLHAD